MEAALQLAYAFSECGPAATGDFINQGAFPVLVNALASTDIATHSHPQVLLIYFDLAVRYTKLCLPCSIRNVVAGLVGGGGLGHPDVRVRSRAAYCFLRITESLESRAYALLPHVGTVASKYHPSIAHSLFRSLIFFFFCHYYPLISNVAMMARPMTLE
jgi:hypothetical protein